jgi:DNA mismatch repair protein MutS
MVEMVETANILNNATDRSLIILDEIGRGTSTYDGVSIAWAVSEYLLETLRARTLFATHYHELTELGERPGAENLTVSVKEQDDEVIFMRKIVEGTADKSYGIYVAQIAGLPREVVTRATNVLSELEAGKKEADTPHTAAISRPEERAVKQILIFDEEHPALEALRATDVNNITPLEALTALAELKKLSEA